MFLTSVIKYVTLKNLNKYLLNDWCIQNYRITYWIAFLLNYVLDHFVWFMGFFFVKYKYSDRSFCKIDSYYIINRSQVSAVGIVTGYGPDDRGVSVLVPVGSRIFSSPCHPAWLWDPPSLLCNGYWELFPWG
jgi:hypothetical protein